MSLSIDRGKVEAGCSGQVSAFFKRCWSEVRQIIDSDYFPEGARIVRARGDRFEFRRAVPFILLHLGCLGVTWVGWSPVAVGVAVALYLLRIFAVTAFYHRYFSHRAFRTSRACQGARRLLPGAR